MLSITGWFNGISAIVLVIFGSLFGLFLILQSKRLKVKLLLFMGITMICAGLIWLGVSCDFLTVLLTNTNLDNSYGLVSLLNFVWLAPGIFFGMYMWAKLMMPDKRHYFLIIYLLIGIAYLIFIFIDDNSFTHVNPETPGENLIDVSLVIVSPAGILSVIIALSNLIFLGFGFLYKTIHSKGTLRKKFLFLSLGNFLLLIFGALDAFTSPDIMLILIRIGVLLSLWFYYMGLREEPDKSEKLSKKKEVKIEGSLFRLSRPTNITEEEVTFHREQKICLVCKGKVSGFNVFICPRCDALYCANCAHTLESSDNACWSCDGPFDPTKPVSLYKNEEEYLDIKKIKESPKISKKHKKSSKK